MNSSCFVVKRWEGNEYEIMVVFTSFEDTINYCEEWNKKGAAYYSYDEYELR